MQSQRSPVGRQLLICDFEAGGELHDGSVSEFTASELVVDTDAQLELRSELELRLMSTPSLPEIWLDVEVKESLQPPAASQLHRRYRLRIRSIPREYLTALGAYDQRRSDEHAADELASSRARLAGGEAEWARALEGGPGRSRGRRRRRPSRAALATSVPGAAPEPEAPTVVVIDGGELDDVCALLGELHAEFARVSAREPDELREWTLPRRLLVTTTRLALALRMPLHVDEDELVAIAVGETGSETLQRTIRRLGFQYLVRRPVHPEALRLLLLQALYRGRDRRNSARLAAGCEVEWSLRWRRRRDPLLEISRRGCRLLTDVDVPAGSRIKLRLPAADSGGRALKLRGRVVRREPARSRVPHRRNRVAVAFEPLGEADARRLERLLARRASGPDTFAGAERAPVVAEALRRIGESAAGGEAPPRDPEPPAAAPEAAGETPPRPPEPREPAAEAEPDRRRRPRAALRGEVLALERAVDRVIHTLVGRDLSPEGLRVEPHPLLALGERVRLGLYAPFASEPLVVGAEVARDDGDLGIWLRFEDGDADVRSRIARHVAALSGIESFASSDSEADHVVLADLVPGEERVA